MSSSTPLAAAEVQIEPPVAAPSRKSPTLERRLTLAVTVIPFVGLIVAVPVFWSRGISALDLLLFVVMYIVPGFGVTVGFHRLLTHRSFEAPRAIRAVLAIAGSMAIEASVIRWVAVHRRHHAFADKEGDPHSPHLSEEQGIKGVLARLWHAHLGWYFDGEETPVERYARDLVKDSALRKVDALFPLWVVASLLVSPVVGAVVTRSASGAATAFLWGSLVRIFFVHHVTFSINSICHFYGKRPFEVPDKSTNNWLLSLVSLGEAWHNNHHAFPTSARHGLDRFQFDPAGALIVFLERAGLARNVKRPSALQIEAKRGARVRSLA